ncbi:hypothetical protein F4775DRAFT_265248 [Biscogniauxia sp. FL1348]|nr:hypothetical protein F4775DRAFT_265248 [Biscogniauxia sp. FL1348]
MEGEITKEHVLRTLDNAIYGFKKPVTSCKDKDLSGLPEAFPVVAKHLPLVHKTLKHIQNYLANHDKTKATRGKYKHICQFAETCQKQAGYIEDIFVAVTAAKDPDQARDRYRSVVVKAKGARIESVLQDILKEAMNVADAPLVDDKLIDRLQKAQTEASELKPSLNEDYTGLVTLNNYGEGSQLYHGGRGNQNHCTGGVQVTGDGAVNHFGRDMRS